MSKSQNKKYLVKLSNSTFRYNWWYSVTQYNPLFNEFLYLVYLIASFFNLLLDIDTNCTNSKKNINYDKPNVMMSIFRLWKFPFRSSEIPLCFLSFYMSCDFVFVLLVYFFCHGVVVFDLWVSFPTYLSPLFYAHAAACSQNGLHQKVISHMTKILNSERVCSIH